MPSSSLFGHLAFRFAASPENIATESLNYILRSAHARSAFVALVEQAAGVELGPAHTFRTQVTGSDTAIPDLVGFDPDGNQSVVVESKFWAALTEEQPLGYVRRLPVDAAGVLVFLVPAARMDLLFDELLRRCREGGLEATRRTSSVADARTATLAPQQRLVVLSWRRVLTLLHHELLTTGESATANDVEQLQGLCERMDSAAVLPFRSEELASELPWRLLQYGSLADAVTNRLVSTGLISVERRRTSAGYGWFGRTADFGDLILFIGFSAPKWARLAATPLWLSIYGANWSAPPSGTHTLLRSLELEDPPRLFSAADHLGIPLFIPTGVEEERIVDALCEQVRKVVALLGIEAVTESG